MNVIDRSCYLVVVDTDQYAGNFEREMGAYLTGRIGDSDTGSLQARIARKEWKELQALEDRKGPFFGLPTPIVVDDSEDGGLFKIWPTEGWVNDGMGVCSKSGKPGYEAYLSVALAYSEELTPAQIKTLTERARRFCENYSQWGRGGPENLTFTGVRVIRRVVTVVDTVVHRDPA